MAAAPGTSATRRPPPRDSMAEPVTRGPVEPISVDAAGAGELLGVSERTVRDWTAEGLLPTIDVGDHRSRIYSVDALRRWALERSGYHAGEEVDHGQARGAGRGPAVQAEVGRALGGGRPRRGQQAQVPVRL